MGSAETDHNVLIAFSILKAMHWAFEVAPYVAIAFAGSMVLLTVGLGLRRLMQSLRSSRDK